MRRRAGAVAVLSLAAVALGGNGLLVATPARAECVSLGAPTPVDETCASVTPDAGDPQGSDVGASASVRGPDGTVVAFGGGGDTREGDGAVSRGSGDGLDGDVVGARFSRGGPGHGEVDVFQGTNESGHCREEGQRIGLHADRHHVVEVGPYTSDPC